MKRGAIIAVDAADPMRIVRDQGYCLLRKPTQDLRTAIPLAARLRRVRTHGPVVDLLEPRPSRDGGDRSLSGRYGLGEFPLHTDCAHHAIPPRFGAMRLASPASDRDTNIVDCHQLIARRSDFARAVCLVSGGQVAFFSKPFVQSGSFVGLRWDPGCMRAASVFEREVEDFASALDALPRLRVEWTSSDVLLWDNWRIAHGRSEAEVGSRECVRVLERALFDI